VILNLYPLQAYVLALRAAQLKAGRTAKMEKRDSFKKRWAHVRTALTVLAVGAIFTPVIISGETGDGFSSHPTAVIASSNRYEPADNRSAGEEPVDEVYEATKDLHETGIAQDVNISTWRLHVEGDKVGNPLSLTYGELQNMEMVKKEVELVCPGVFTDIAEWEGVPLLDILEKAQVAEDYDKVYIQSSDGYRSVFDRESIDSYLIFLALKVNGVTLPKEHGYPARLVAENISGGKWVKWIKSIEVK
jgi:sulfoxide reductase catalytic subunit YedY